LTLAYDLCMKPAQILLAVALVVPALSAADLGKYRDWASSPEAYFMTRAERQAWPAVKTEAEAEQFVTAFIARRKPDFVAEVAKRAQVADKYLTVGKTPGSKTLRGKVIILLGPPTAFDVARRTQSGERSSGQGAYMGLAGGSGPGAGGGGGGTSTADAISASQRSDMSVREIRQFTITYSGDRLPRPRAATLTVAIDVDTVNERESLADKSLMPELEELFETAVNTWLKK